MNQSRRSAVLWLTRQGFQLYINGQKALLSFNFSPESVKYFDVVEEEKFLNQLELFMTQNSLNFLDTYFIIASEALLEKEFVSGRDDLVNQFIEVVPYEMVFSKKKVMQKSVLVSCFNAVFYQLINTVWVKHGCQIKLVLPYSYVGQTKFDIQSAILILKKADSLKNESMVSAQENEAGELLVVDSQPKNQEKSTLPIILPVFLILILILAFMIFNSLKTPALRQPLTSPTPTTIIIPTPTNFPSSNVSPSISEPPNSSKSAFPLIEPTL